MGSRPTAALLLLFAASAAALLAQGSDACAACHPKIYESYRRTGMGRSFYRPGPSNTVEDYSRKNTYYHEASEQYYTMSRRGGRYYQRRHQIGPDGRETNVIEKEIHFVLGSGNQVRSYLHKAPDGQLLQLPVAWYGENGGFWGMNPGYERPDHMDFRRRIDRECFFCHNAYPETAGTGDPGTKELFLRGAIPEGIDCQRCHGPGEAHMRNVRKPGAIVNPARLSPERQLEICLQCHLESTSRRLPYAIRRFGRSYFSYRPWEALGDYILHFDQATGAGDKFEIAHSAYRLLQSACFRKSNGALTCTTCHNPHEAPRAEEAAKLYIQACLRCHAAAHRASENCLGCHMPRRRTDDVVHAIMTDHYIPRHKADRDLLAPLREVREAEQPAYRGEVVLLYPPRLPSTRDAELYLAVAQVTEDANLVAGLPRLQKAIETFRPPEAEFQLELANAYAKSDQNEKALHYYEEALRRKPGFLAARRDYATALSKLGRWTAAAETLEAAVRAAPNDAASLNALGSTYLQLGKLDLALTTLRRALLVAPDLPEILVNLGTVLFRRGDQPGATEALQNAVLARPGFAAAHNNLASALNAQGDFRQAEYHFRRALRLDPGYAVAHYNFGRALAENGRREEAEAELRAALKLDPRQAEAATSLGLLLAQQGRREDAIALYRQALQVRPRLAAAHFNLGLALLQQGEKPEAKGHFQAAIQSDPNDHQAHFHLGMIFLGDGNYALATTHLQKASDSSRPEVRNAAREALRTARDKK